MTTCPQCGTGIGPHTLSCPSCHALIHAARLKELSAQAADALNREDKAAALAAWEEALLLLPHDSVQYQKVKSAVDGLREQVPPAQEDHAPSEGWRKVIGALGPIGVVVWLLVSKGKFLLLGLSKISTLLSMAAFFGVYWSAHGWKYALGIVISIYIHEMGHVAKLAHYGIKASAPMFIPGLGAFVFLKQNVTDRIQDSRVGLAGPIWGTGAALAALALGGAFQSKSLLAIGVTGAWINLFNLIPVWTLDGGRGFRSFTQRQRGLAVLVILGTLVATGEGMLVLLLLGAAYQFYFHKVDAAPEPDSTGWLQYTGLVILLSIIASFKAAGPV